MASLGQAFDANTVEPSAPSDLLPPGDYKAEIVRSEMKETSKGGQMLELEMSIIDGTYRNRRIFDRLNLVCASDVAQQIARQTLSAICRATGQMTVSDSDQLHTKPMTVKVAVKAASGDYGPSNVVKGYSKPTGASGGGYTSAARMAAPAAPSAPSAPPSAPAKAMPWERPK